MAVAFIVESMISHLFLDAWENQYIQKRPKSSNKPFEYFLVLKDDFSGLAELIPTTAADHSVVADALEQLYSRFDMLLCM